MNNDNNNHNNNFNKKYIKFYLIYTDRSSTSFACVVKSLEMRGLIAWPAHAAGVSCRPPQLAVIIEGLTCRGELGRGGPAD